MSSGDPDTEPYTISPAFLIEVLDSAKESLEELHLEIDCGELAEQFEPGVEDDFIDSIVHFESLRVLSTPAEMWSGHLTDIDAFFAERSLEEEDRLCRRLPQSLEVLRFRLSDEGSELPFNQLRDLCRTHVQTLPNLRRLTLGSTNDPIWLECFETIVTQEKDALLASQGAFEVEIDEPVKTAWDDFPSSSRLPDLRWFGTKYAILKRKLLKKPFQNDIRRFREQYRNRVMGDPAPNEDEDDDETSEMTGRVDVQLMLQRRVQERENVLQQQRHELQQQRHEPPGIVPDWPERMIEELEVLYESTEEENSRGTPHLDDSDDS